MTKLNSYRQGDVLLIEVAAIPATAKPIQPEPNRPPILAYGETTGHAHSLYGKATMFRDDGSGSVYIRAENATLAHGTPVDAVTIPRDPDHEPIALNGLYRAVRQVEFPRAAPVRQVAD